MTPKPVQKLHGTTGMLLCAWVSMACLTSCHSPDKPPATGKPKLPLGVIDIPKPGAVIRGSVGAGGWAISESGVKEVCLYVDRDFVKCTAVDGKRPDVAKAYPNIARNDNCGWNTILETTSYQPGNHELTIQAIDKSGSTKDIGTIPFVVVQ